MKYFCHFFVFLFIFLLGFFFPFLAGEKAPLVSAEEEDDDEVPGKDPAYSNALVNVL